MRRHGKYLLFVLLSIFLISQTGVLPAEGQQASKPLTLKANIFPHFSSAPFFITQEEGYFAEQNLNVEFVRLKENVAFAALAKGELDVWSGLIAIGAMNAIQRGSNIRFVAPRGSFEADGCPYFGLVVRKALIDSGQLNSPADLKGRNLAWYRASFEEYYLEKVLQKSGLTLDDVTKITIPPPADLSAMAKGKIDLTVTGEPWITRLVNAGHAVLWKRVQEDIPGFQSSSVMYGPNLLETNPDAGRRFMVAYFKGVRKFNDGKTDSNLKHISKHTGIDKKILKQACWSQFRNDGRMNIQSFKDIQNWAVIKGYLEKAVPVDGYLDLSFIEHANKVLGNTQ